MGGTEVVAEACQVKSLVESGSTSCGAVTWGELPDATREITNFVRGSSVIHHHVRRVQKKASTADAMRTLPRLAKLSRDARAWGARRWLRRLAK